MNRRPGQGGIFRPARILFAALALLSCPPALAGVSPSSFQKPYPGEPAAIGSAANGCLAGARPLALSGPGYETLRPARNRFWGHPALLALIEDVAGSHPAGPASLLIGDLAQPRGGRMPSGHGSHQTGLDVDILYRLADGPLDAAARAEPAMDSVIDAGGEPLGSLWGPAQAALVKAFAIDSRVERIFVNPVIKRALCREAGQDRDWLQKVRPWWGHDDHFHVRIGCPEGDDRCVPGPGLPPGDGCGFELQSWIASGDWRSLPKPAKQQPPVAAKALPEACRAIFR